MIGEARALAVDVVLPEGVTLRRVTEEADVRAMAAMQDEAFGDPVSEEMADALAAPAGPRRRDGAVGRRGGRAGRQRRPAGAGARHRLRRDLGRRDPGRSGAAAASTGR